MASTYVRYPNLSIPKYATVASLPTLALDGDLAVTLDTDTLYIYTGAAWAIIGAGGSTVTTIGTIDSATASANGAVISSNALIMQSASATVPGLMNTGTQTIAGNKQFTAIGLGISPVGGTAVLCFSDTLSDKIQFNGIASNAYKISKAAAVGAGDGMFKFVAGATGGGGTGEFGFYTGSTLNLFLKSDGKATFSGTVTFQDDVSGLIGSGTSIATSTVTARSLNARFADSYNVKDFGALANGTDDRVAIQACIDAAATAGKKVWVPAGTYTLTKGAANTDEAGTNYPCLLMRTNMWIEADAGAVFKLKSGESTGVLGSTYNIPMFFTNGTLDSVTIRGLTIDMNYPNNLIRPTSSQMTFAHIMVSGTPAGVGARVDNALIENCTFLNTPGATCIGMAQSNTNSITLGRKWRITNCYFYNNGYDSTDHSSLYAFADDVIISNCIFDEPTMHSAATSLGGLVACEIHGARQLFVNNTVRNYYQAMWVSTNQTSAVEDCVISDNVFGPLETFGVGVQRFIGGQDIKRISILNNSFRFNNDTTNDGIKYAVYIAPEYKVSEILVSGNRGELNSATYPGAFIVISNQNTVAIDGAHTGITVRDNQASGFTYGVLAATTANSGLGSIVVSDNTFFNLKPNGSHSISAGISTSGASAITYLACDNNTIFDDQVSGTTDHGAYLRGVITTLQFGSLKTSSLSSSDYLESSLTVTTRKSIPTFSGMDLSTSSATKGLRIYSSETDAATKVGRILGRQYTNANTDFLALDVRGVTGANELGYGGGSNSFNCATKHSFFTAADTTTVLGTERVTITSAGLVTVAGLTASRALTTDSSKSLASSATTDTELGYVSGVTSAIQTQLNARVSALAAIGSSPNANAATLSSGTLNLEPASASFGGVVTTGTQTIAGAKTLTGVTSVSLTGNALSYLQIFNDSGTAGGTSPGTIRLSPTSTVSSGQLYVDLMNDNPGRIRWTNGAGTNVRLTLYVNDDNSGLSITPKTSATNTLQVTGNSSQTALTVTNTSNVAFFSVTTAGVIQSSALTASQAVFTDASKNLVSNAITGSGNVVMSASPTLTGTIGAANQTLSGTLGVTGVATFTAQPIMSSLTASLPVFTDASKGLVSNAMTGTGSVVMSSSPTIATPTITTSATCPAILGGTGTTSTLVLRSTTGVGATGADIIFQVGNNGATEAARILNDGTVGIGLTTAIQSGLLNVQGSIVARNGGVDGTFANAFLASYTANTSEHNVIQSSVSSTGTSSGFRFKASDGGGASTTTTVLDLARTQITAYAGLDVSTASATVGMRIYSATADATTKVGRILGKQYTNANTDFLAIDVRGLNGANGMQYGGGSNSFNCATSHGFFTAANVTTVLGTEQFTISSAGNITYAQAIANSGLALRTTTGNFTVADNVSYQIIDATQATATVTMPANPINGQLITIAGQQNTIITVSANSGQSIKNGTITGTATGEAGKWIYRLADTTWYSI